MSFHNQSPQDSAKCLELIQTSPSVTYLNHESATVRLQKPGGPKTTFKVFASPYSPAKDLWAFGYQPEEAADLWNQIPLDADIVVTHTPPKYHCDESRSGEAAGCEQLRQALWRVRPRFAVCGHVHEGRGVERVRWDLTSPSMKYNEEHTRCWIDPGLGNKKQSLVDLSIRGGEPLDNDGNRAANREPADSIPTADRLNRKSPCWSYLRPGRDKRYPPIASHSLPSQPLLTDASTSPEIDMTVIQCATSNTVFFECPRTLSSERSSHETTEPRTRGQGEGEGGLSPLRRCDLDALTNGQGRKETCIVNAAMMASSWPHKGYGGQRHHKPIVVDIDLPVWD